MIFVESVYALTASAIRIENPKRHNIVYIILIWVLNSRTLEISVRKCYNISSFQHERLVCT